MWDFDLFLEATWRLRFFEFLAKSNFLRYKSHLHITFGHSQCMCFIFNMSFGFYVRGVSSFFLMHKITDLEKLFFLTKQRFLTLIDYIVMKQKIIHAYVL